MVVSDLGTHGTHHEIGIRMDDKEVALQICLEFLRQGRIPTQEEITAYAEVYRDVLKALWKAEAEHMFFFPSPK